jgi:hypothetical protein
MLRRLLAFLVVSLLGSVAAAQPKVCGNQAALGGWSLPSCPQLKDDGVAPDEAAGDGIYSLAVQLGPTALLEYKVLPSGTWDGATEIKAAATCPWDGGATANSNQNIQIPSPDTSQPTRFFYDGRTALDPSYAPPSSGRSAGDSAMLGAPAGSCPGWLAVGDFQTIYGNNPTAVRLLPLRPGVWSGRLTAAQALPAGWRWRLLEQTSGVGREYGPAGWAYAPCHSSFASVSSAVAVGDTVYFLFHADGGRLQTVVSSTPLDGFAADGGGLCQAPPDLGNPGGDLAASAADLADPGRPSDLAAADGGPHPRLGIHCDCKLATGGGPALPAAAPAAVGLLLFVLTFRQHRRRQRKLLPARRAACQS